MRAHPRWIACSLNTQAGLDRWRAAWHNICSDPPSKGRVEGMMEGCDGLVLSECLLLCEPDLHTALLLFPTVGRRTWNSLDNKKWRGLCCNVSLSNSWLPHRLVSLKGGRDAVFSGIIFLLFSRNGWLRRDFINIRSSSFFFFFFFLKSESSSVVNCSLWGMLVSLAKRNTLPGAKTCIYDIWPVKTSHLFYHGAPTLDSKVRLSEATCWMVRWSLAISINIHVALEIYSIHY